MGKAERDGQPVDHPLADQIRQASRQPEEALNFFVKLLHPIPDIRCSALQATQHMYFHTAMQRVMQELPTTPSLTPVATLPLAAVAAAPVASIDAADVSAAALLRDMQLDDSDVHIEADSATAMSSLSSCASTAPAQQRPTLFSKLLSFMKAVKQCRLLQAIAMAKDILLRKLMPQRSLQVDTNCRGYLPPKPFVAEWVSECAAHYPFQPVSVPLPSNRMKHALQTLYHSTPVTARQHILDPKQCKRDAEASASLPADRLHNFAEGHPQVEPGSSAAMVSLADNHNHAATDSHGGRASSMTSSSDDQDSCCEASSSSLPTHTVPDLADGLAADHRYLLTFQLQV